MSLAHASGRSAMWLLVRPALANAATVGFLTAMVKLAGAAKIVVTARYFGVSDDLDAFLTAFVMPSLLADVVAGTFTPALVPALIRVGAAQGRDAARGLARSASGLALGAMLVVALALAAGGRWLLPLLGTSFPQDKLALTRTLFLGLLFWLPLGGLISCWRAVLNSHSHFALAAGVPLATPAVTLLLIYTLAARWGVYALCAATLTGVLIECLVLAGAVRRLRYPILPGLHWTPELRAVRREYLPLMAGAMISSASLLVDQFFAGTLGPGAVSALSYGTKLAAVLFSVLAAGIATAVLPEFSALATAATATGSDDQWPRLRRSALSHGGLAILVVVPLTLVLIWLSGPIVRIFFEGGRFNSATARLVSTVQQCALVEAPFAILFAIASRLATAMSANGLLVRAGVAALAVNIVADWLLTRWIGVSGIALSTSIVRAVALVVLVVLIVRREPRLSTRDA